MREQLINSLFEKMESNSDLFFLTADMGINLVEKFGDHYPERYANVGIAEQNLIAISAGLCNLGFRPFVYTISNFLIHRCFEQIRNDIGLHRYPVTLIGTSTGFDNAPLGPTHHIVDDWGSLKNFPNIDVYCPTSPEYASSIVDKILESDRPAYIRVPKGSGLDMASDHLVHISGLKENVLICGYGSTASLCWDAQQKNPYLGLLIFQRLVPLDEIAVIDIAKNYERIIVVEDHFSNTGLYGSLCELAVRMNLGVVIDSLAPSDYEFKVGCRPADFFDIFNMNVSDILELAGV